MTMFFDQLLNLAQIVIFISFLVKDMMWLRLLSIIASVCFINYFFTRPEVVMAGVFWNTVYLIINAYQIYKLYHERKPVRLTAQQENIHRHLFPEITPRELLNLVTLAEQSSPQVGERLVQANHIPTHLYLVSEGQVEMQLSTTQALTLTQYQMIGELSYLTGQAPKHDIVINQEGVKLFSWSIPQLDSHLERYPQTKICLQRAVSRDLARKLYTSSPKLMD